MTGSHCCVGYQPRQLSLGLGIGRVGHLGAIYRPTLSAYDPATAEIRACGGRVRTESKPLQSTLDLRARLAQTIRARLLQSPVAQVNAAMHRVFLTGWGMVSSSALQPRHRAANVTAITITAGVI